MLGSGFGRTDFSRIFIFGPPDFFADFVAGFFLLIIVGKSAQKNPPGKSPQKSSKIYTTNILRHTSADWAGQEVEVRYPPLQRGISAILARYPMKTRQMGAIPPLRYCLERALHQGQKSAQGILHLRNPNSGPNSVKRILDA